MMFGHVETLEERVEHLLHLRDLQDRTGGFTAFIGWTFQPENTALAGDELTATLPPIDRLLEYDPPVATRVYFDDGLGAGWQLYEVVAHVIPNTTTTTTGVTS